MENKKIFHCYLLSCNYCKTIREDNKEYLMNEILRSSMLKIYNNIKKYYLHIILYKKRLFIIMLLIYINIFVFIFSLFSNNLEIQNRNV